MQILVDADACPREVKEILYRTADRTPVATIFVANQWLRTPESPNIKSIGVPQGPDVADDRIVELVQPGDLVITADIPLADRVVKKGALALDPRGEAYDEENIGTRLATRDLLQELRDNGMMSGGNDTFGPRDRQRFANELNTILTRLLRRSTV